MEQQNHKWTNDIKQYEPPRLTTTRTMRERIIGSIGHFRNAFRTNPFATDMMLLRTVRRDDNNEDNHQDDEILERKIKNAKKAEFSLRRIKQRKDEEVERQRAFDEAF